MAMDIDLIKTIQIPTILFFVSLFVRAIFSFLETSVTALRLFKLKELAQSTSHYQVLFKTLEHNPHKVLITILIANSFADVTTAALANNIMEAVSVYFNLSSNVGLFLGIGIASIAIIIFGEIVPKSLAQGRGERLFKSMLWLTNLVFYILSPLATVLVFLSDILIKKIGGTRPTKTSSDWVTSEKEIRFLIDYIKDKGVMDTEKTQMLQNIFELGRTQVKDVVVPAPDMISVDIRRTINETLDIFSKHQFTRLPVYEGKTDNIIGMVHQKDIFVLLSKGEDKPLREIVRPIMFIPESIKVNQLLKEFRQQHMHIAIVLDEHGSVTGLVTLEDVLEEIVGEISDEHEPTTEKIVSLQQGGWLIDASVPLEELEGLLHIRFETEDALTLGGFLIEQLRHLPKKGERILYKNYYFQIQKASAKRVLQVLVFEEKNAKHHE